MFYCQCSNIRIPTVSQRLKNISFSLKSARVVDEKLPVEITTFAMTEMGWVFAFRLNETMENVVSNNFSVIKNHQVTDFEIKRKY